MPTATKINEEQLRKIQAMAEEIKAKSMEMVLKADQLLLEIKGKRNGRGAHNPNAVT